MVAAIFKDRWQVELFFKGAETDVEDQDVCRDQRECGQDAGLDGADRHAAVEIPAIEIDALLVVVESGRASEATTVLLSRFVGLVG